MIIDIDKIKRNLATFTVILLVLAVLMSVLSTATGFAALPWYIQAIIAFPIGYGAAKFSDKCDEVSDKYLK